MGVGCCHRARPHVQGANLPPRPERGTAPTDSHPSSKKDASKTQVRPSRAGPESIAWKAADLSLDHGSGCSTAHGACPAGRTLPRGRPTAGARQIPPTPSAVVRLDRDSSDGGGCSAKGGITRSVLGTTATKPAPSPSAEHVFAVGPTARLHRTHETKKKKKVPKRSASVGSRTRANCLEGNYPTVGPRKRLSEQRVSSVHVHRAGGGYTFPSEHGKSLRR